MCLERININISKRFGLAGNLCRVNEDDNTVFNLRNIKLPRSPGSCLLSRNLMVSAYANCATKSLLQFIQNMKEMNATICKTGFTVPKVGVN